MAITLSGELGVGECFSCSLHRGDQVPRFSTIGAVELDDHCCVQLNTVTMVVDQLTTLTGQKVTINDHLNGH